MTGTETVHGMQVLIRCILLGKTGWTSVIGDWNGDNKTEIGIYRDGASYLDSDGNGAWNGTIDYVYTFGAPG